MALSSYNTSSQPAALELVSATGGDPVQIYWSAWGFFGQLAWSPDARKIAFCEELPDGFSCETKVLNLEDMSVTTVPGPESHPLGLSWARGHDRLAFSGSGRDALIYTMELPSGTSTVVGEGVTPDWSPDDEEIVYLDRRGLWRLEVATGAAVYLGSGGRSPAWRRF